MLRKFHTLVRLIRNLALLPEIHAALVHRHVVEPETWCLAPLLMPDTKYPIFGNPGYTNEMEMALDAARWAWRDHMQPFMSEYGVLNLPAPPSLEQRHVANARLFGRREDFLDTLAKGGSGAEIGVWKGDFSLELIGRTKPEKLHLFDMDFDRFNVRDRLEQFVKDGIVEFHEGTSADTVARLANNSLDWAYIDAGHSYLDARRDAEVAATKLKPGGIIIFNDYIAWSHTESIPYGVVATVNELCVHEGWEVVGLSLHNAMYCDIAIRRQT